MFRIDHANAVAAAPAVPAPSTQGYFTNGVPPVTPPTPVPDWWLNMVQEEIRGVIVAAGLTPTKTDNGQLEEAVHGSLGVFAHATDTAASSTFEKRALLASTTARASGLNSAIAASTDLTATGAQSMGVASDGEAAGITLTGAQSFVAACLGGTNGIDVGLQCVALASENSDVIGEANTVIGCSGVDFHSAADHSTAISSTGVSATDTFESGSDYSLAAACVTPALVGSPLAAMIGTRACEVELAHGSWPEEAGLLVGSKNARLADPHTLALGYDGSALAGTGNENITIKFTAVDGVLYATNTTVQAADYAELFPNVKKGILPVGTLISLKGSKVETAGDKTDDLLGVVSSVPGIVGNSASLAYRGKFELDDFGRPLSEDVAMIQILKAGGNGFALFDGREDELPEIYANHPEELVARYVAESAIRAADYDPTRVYVPRADRPEEWTTVALLGQVPVRVGAGVKVGDRLRSGAGGIGVSASKTTRPELRVQVMEITKAFDDKAGFAIAQCLIK